MAKKTVLARETDPDPPLYDDLGRLDPAYRDTAGAARYCRLTLASFRRYVWLGRIPAIRTAPANGGTRTPELHFRLRDLDRFLAEDYTGQVGKPRKAQASAGSSS